MGFIKEFKEFAMKGNVMDMAVGVIIGGAFGKIVSSLVGDVIMPAIGALMGGLDFTSLRWVIREAYTTEGGKEIAEAALNYGNFIQTLVDFLIIALSIFFVIKGINKVSEKANAKKKAAEKGTVSASFKKTMDEYERFFDEYVKFMKKYKKNPTDMGLLSDLSDYMDRYTKFMDKLDSVDTSELSAADAAYYTKVSARIMKKLSEVV